MRKKKNCELNKVLYFELRHNSGKLAFPLLMYYLVECVVSLYILDSHSLIFSPLQLFSVSLFAIQSISIAFKLALLTAYFISSFTGQQWHPGKHHQSVGKMLNDMLPCGSLSWQINMSSPFSYRTFLHRADLFIIGIYMFFFSSLRYP